MENIYELTGDDLESLLAHLGVPAEAAARVYEARVCIDGGFKISVNGGTWSPPLGVPYK